MAASAIGVAKGEDKDGATEGGSGNPDGGGGATVAAESTADAPPIEDAEEAVGGDGTIGSDIPEDMPILCIRASCASSVNLR